MFVGAFFVLDSSLACFFLYTCAIVCGRYFFRTSNIHTLHSLVICQGHPSTVFCKISVRISKYRLKISTAPERLNISG